VLKIFLDFQAFPPTTEEVMTEPYFTMSDNLALIALRFAEIKPTTDEFDSKLEEPMLCFGYSISDPNPDWITPVFQIKDKKDADKRGAEFTFSTEQEKQRFLEFVARTVSKNTEFAMVTPPTQALLQAFATAAHCSLSKMPEHDVQFRFVFPHHLLMALLVSENYQFTAQQSLRRDGKVVRLLLTVDHANCDEPTAFNLECSFVGGHGLDEAEVRGEVDRLFGLTQPVTAS